MSIAEIQNERDAQRVKWGESADDLYTAGEWAALVSHYATRQVVGDLRGVNLTKLRADMVKVGALALACIESLDRKGV